MGSDFILVIQWWGTLFLVGTAAYPLTKVLFGDWWDKGYFFAKAVGMATVTYLVYLLGTLHLLPFSQMSIALAMAVVFAGGVLINIKNQATNTPPSSRPPSRDPVFYYKDGFRVKPGMTRGFTLFIEEVFFFAALLFWSFIKAHEPSIHNLEKFMDFGFTKSILNNEFFPAPDMWYAGATINYYYFGHIVMAVLTKFSGLSLRYTFNLMLSSLFAFTATMSFSIGFQISQIGQIRRIGKSLIAGGLTAFLVTLAGNMQTLYAFTRGYDGDKVKPFWQLLWPLADFWQKLPEGLNRYWYANATRFIPYTIHEFPSYSFVVSDVHGHVLSLPFVLLAIALLIKIAISDKRQVISQTKRSLKFGLSLITSHLSLIFYGFLVAILLMTNALDGPVYFALIGVVIIAVNLPNLRNWANWKVIIGLLGLVGVAAGFTSLPFIVHFHSFVSGLAINCPPAFLANSKIGPFLFEGVEKCQHSPLWMLFILWGFFLYCGVSLMVSKIFPYVRHSGLRAGIRLWWIGSRVKPGMTEQPEKLLVIFFIFSVLLIIFPEFFYFKDIYPMHFRSNTMFKLGYQAFIMFGIVSGYTIVNWLATSDKRQAISKKIFFVFLIPLIFLVSIYPIFSVRSYFDSLRTYRGLDGLSWFMEQYPGDYEAIEWLNKNCQPSAVSCQLVEADGDSYTDYARFSALTGLPAVIGWPVHEWLWRGSYDMVAPRRADVDKIYESQDLTETERLLKAYKVKYVIVGSLEREKFSGLLNEWKFMKLGRIAFQSGSTIIYEIHYGY